MKETKHTIKEVENIKNSLIETKIFVDVKVELMDAASGVANITLDLDDKYFDEILRFEEE